MTRLVLYALLGVSLAINVWLLLPERSRPASAAPDAAKTVAAPVEAAAAIGAMPAADATPPATAAPSSPARRGFAWKKRPATDDDFRELAADLRTAGFPPRVVARLVAELYQQHALANSPLGTTPYWQFSAGIMSDGVRSVYRTLPAKIAELLGPDASPSLRLTAVERHSRYGPLPDAKVDALIALERDYSDLRNQAYTMDGGHFDAEAYRALEKRRALVDAERLADLAGILTPDELREYQARNSPSARSLAASFGDMPLSAAQFAALADARQAYDAVQRSARSGSAVLTQQEHAAAQTAYYDRARAVLPEESFYRFLEASDMTFRSIARLRVQFPAVTSAAAYAAWQLSSEFAGARMALVRSRPSIEQYSALSADFNARLDRTLGPEAAAAFRKTPPGRMFATPTPRPPPANPSASPRN
jgi:hypothetical protein